MSQLPKVIIKARRARPFFARHPWVFVTSIDGVEAHAEPSAGQEVTVHSREGQFIGRGLYNPNSAIRVRLYRWEDQPIDEAYLGQLLERAVRFRTAGLGLDRGDSQSAYRAVYSEADGLSGLTVDRFGDYLSVQFTSLALYERREFLIAKLAELTGAKGILVKGEKSTSGPEGLKVEEGLASGEAPTGPVAIREHDLTYKVDLVAGQKTGFYLDQRDNRRAVAAYAKGKRVLDLFCYTGGFALNAIKHGGAASALAFDSSAPAINLARENAVENQIGSARFEVSDVQAAVDRLRSSGEKFGLIVCDPPKFARHAKGVEDALRAYVALNRNVVDLLEPDGILATCSCSGLVDKGLFADLIGQVAEQSRRPIQILEQRGQATDHPVSASCLETEYLKCFVLRVQ